jgi:hypothetical protein
MRRWIRYEAPVMVCVELDDDGHTGTVVNVVLGDEQQDVELARDHLGRFLVYDETMQPVQADDSTAALAITISEHRDWPERPDWEEGPDALRYPGLYDIDEPNDEDDMLESLDYKEQDTNL